MNLKTLGLGTLFVLAPVCGILAQQGDTTKFYNLKDVVVSATKSEREMLLTPVRISSVPIQSIRSAPMLSSEDIIKGVSGLVVSRTLGIFDKNASVTARGLGKEQARTLIMIDGIPINKASTGSANFSMINTALIDRVEVVKGPNSNIFGGNAMGGSVNFITREPSEGFRSFIQTDYGSYNTVGTKASATYSHKGFFGGASAFARKSDGYNPYDNPDSSTIAASLTEKSAGAFAGYKFGGNSMVKAEFNITDALRGKGERLYTSSGVIDGTNHYTNRNYRLSYSGKSGASDWNLTAFLSTENYSEIKWKGSDIFDVIVDRKDYGVWASYSYSGIKNHSIGAGIEYKGGFVDGADDYRTSTDVVINRGKSNGFSLYVLDEISLKGGRITIVPSVRGDIVNVYDGGFFTEGATGITSYLQPYTGSLENTTWSAFSPKLAARYGIGSQSRIYASASRGFRPGSLEDMTRTGAISGGVILANTALRPEFINTYEAGADLTLAEGLVFSPTVYYSDGTDFHYAVNTGQTIRIGSKNRPLLRMQNVGKVEIYGAEADLNWSPLAGLDLFANYTYTHSVIAQYDADPQTGNTDITGKFLTFTPKHMINAGATSRNRFVNVTINWRHTSSQFMDTMNSPDSGSYINNIPALDIVDAKIWRGLGKNFVLSLGVNNLLNKTYVNTSGHRSIGRYLFTQINITL